MLRGLQDRLSQGLERLESQRLRHGEELSNLEEQLAAEKKRLETSLLEQRRGRLATADEQDEYRTSYYERETLSARAARSELQTRVRKERRRGRHEIAQKTAEQTAELQKAFAADKLRPPRLRSQQEHELAVALDRCVAGIEAVRTILLRRTGAVDPAAEPIVPSDRPGSVKEAVERIDERAAALRTLERELATVGPAWFLESYRLALALGAVAVLWALIVWLASATPLLLWLIAALPIAGAVGLVAHLVFSPYVRRASIQRYPEAERLFAEAMGLRDSGRRLAADDCDAALDRLTRQRDEALKHIKEEGTRLLDELNERLDQQLREGTAELDQRLRILDAEYRDAIRACESSLQKDIPVLVQKQAETQRTAAEQMRQQRADLTAAQRDRDRRLTARVRGGVSRGLAWIDRSCGILSQRHPSWDEVARGEIQHHTVAGPLPVGTLRIDGLLDGYLQRFQQSQWSIPATTVEADANPAAARSKRARRSATSRFAMTLPVTITPSREAGLLIDCPPQRFSAARDLVRTVLSRGLAAISPGRLRLLLCDPLYRGEMFASFMPLGDHDPQLVGSRVWTAPAQIEARLTELAHHMEDVLQTFLRDAYDSIEQYNQSAGPLAEPYRAVAMFGLPAGLTTEGCDALRALLSGGPRCGMFVVLVRDPSQPWPQELATLPTDNLVHLRIDEAGRLQHTDPMLASLPLDEAPPPAPQQLAALLDRVGSQAIEARKVEIPFDQLLDQPVPDHPRYDSSESLEVPLGVQGAGRPLSLRLGEGVRQHVLVAGKTGSGKSTMLHTLIVAAAARYRPDQLQFYLLDFKKGVEFKPYADEKLPHARVIGIESEREFGLSVLKRLDRELQQRGERFRSAGASALADFRERTGESLPRILLIVDEFQELFTRDDALAGECTMLLDRLVRQGRSFGMHVLLASQSLSGAYSLPRATLGQMAVRIALQCSEADAMAILSEDNTAARLLARPGEAIYNDASGLIEGNQPFQVAYLPVAQHRAVLQQLRERDSSSVAGLDPNVVFEGSQAARWSEAESRAAGIAVGTGARAIRGMLGQAVSLSPPLTIELVHQNGRNVLVTSAEAHRIGELVNVLTASIAADAVATGRPIEFLFFDAARSDLLVVPDVIKKSGLPCERITARHAEERMVALAQDVAERIERDDPESEVLKIVVVHPLERFRDLRHEESFSFSSGPQEVSGATALQAVLRDGPAAGVHTVLCSGGYETLSRWLPRASLHDLDLRVLGRVNTADSVQLIDTPDAANLSGASMLLYDDATACLDKLRVYATPDPEALVSWIKSFRPS